jgi:hypothetical protein
MSSLFEEQDGLKSMRRVLAFMFALTSILGGILSVILKSEWKLVALAYGIPAFVTIILLLFTTWESIVKLIESIRKTKNEESK